MPATAHLARALALGVVLAPAAVAHGPQAGAGSDSERVALSSMRRVLRHFDFEEATLAPYDMPIHFYRHIATDRGFPRFGRMHLSDDEAAGGRWSFRFDLGGGSMSARVPTAVLPALPGGLYVVSVKVKTRGLVHARAGLGVWLHDVTGGVIPSSRVQSALVLAEDGWRTLEVTVPADVPNVSDIVVELQVLQPGHVRTPDLGSPATPQDVSGRAWFDDVVVRLVPRIGLSVDAPGAVVSGTRPSIRAAIRDLAREPLRGRLVVSDLDGRPVHEETFEASRPTVERVFPLVLPRLGWYRATLELSNDQGLVGARTLDLACVPDLAGGRVARGAATTAFAVELAPVGPDDAWTADLVARLGVDRVIVPIFTERDARLELEGAGDALGLLRRIHRAGIGVIGSIDALPIDRRAGAPHSLDDPAGWRDLVHRVTREYGRVSEAWRIGEAVGAGDPREAEARIAALVGVLHEYGAEEIFVASRNGAVAPAGSSSLEPVGTATTIRPPGLESARVDLERLLVEALRAWRRGEDIVAVEAPWRVTGSVDVTVEPTPAYPAWRELAGHLAGRRFTGSKTLAEGVECWTLSGAPGEDDALVTWVRPEHPDDTVTVKLQTSGRRYDVFGNTSTVHQEMVAERLPVFIEPISP